MKYRIESTFNKLTTADLLVRIGIPRHQAEAFALKLPLLTPAAEPDPNGLFMALNREAASPEAKALVEAIATDVHRITGGIYQITKKMRLTVGAIIADLLHSAALGPDSYRYRSLGSDSFSESYIGLESYKKSLKALEILGLISTIIGGFFRAPGTGGGLATKVFPLATLLDEAKSHGVDLAQLDAHFPLASASSPLNNSVVLKSASVKKMITYGAKTPGKPMKVDHRHATVIDSKSRLADLNLFYAKHTYEACGVPALRRIFNMGDTPGFDYDKGGRVYGYGPDNYQNKPSADRRSIRINGLGVTEIDLKASHPTIFAAQSGCPIDPRNDLYAGDGSIPRAIIKRYVLQSLGGNAPATTWDDDNRAWYTMEHNDPAEDRDLQIDHPIGRVRAAAFASFPALRGWSASPLIWADLHFIESEVILDAICILAFEHGVPALPVHDSLIVPEDQVDLAIQVLTQCFDKHVGQKPVIERK